MAGGGVLYYDSGPGVQLLSKGDLEAGFFGEVSSAELFSTSQLSNQLNYAVGTIIEEYPIWLKFAYKGKFLFIPKAPIKNSVTWVSLYAAGLIYGVDGTGPLGDLIPENNVNQLAVAQKGLYRFKVRLMRGLPTDPHVTNSSTTDTDLLADSEWNKLLYRVSAELSSASVGPKWAEYTATELGVNSTPYNQFTVTQERSANYTSVVGRGGSGIRYIPVLSKNVVQVNQMWRPVLELLPSDYVLSDTGVAYQTDVTLRVLSTPVAKLVLDNRDVLPVSTPTWVIPTDGDDTPVLADASATYATSETILPITTPRALGVVPSTAFPAAKLAGGIVEPDLALRTPPPVHKADGVTAVGGFRGTTIDAVLSPSTPSWSIVDEGTYPPISSSLTVKDLSGFEAA
jgi:hypothetical protein